MYSINPSLPDVQESTHQKDITNEEKDFVRAEIKDSLLHLQLLRSTEDKTTHKPKRREKFDALNAQIRRVMSDRHHIRHHISAQEYHLESQRGIHSNSDHQMTIIEARFQKLQTLPTTT